jgi:hypothetical protein
MSTNLHFFTIVARNYLAYALALGDSVKKSHPEAQFSIMLLDDKNHELADRLRKPGFHSIYPENLALPDFNQFVFKYNITEASTGVKPFVIKRLFDAGAEKVVYLDPDILAYRRFDEVLAALDNSSIVITPHICSPAGDDVYPDDLNHLQSGVYNLGFIALRNDGNANNFILWWIQKLLRYCIDEPALGLFVDQKWVDLLPACFDGVRILRNPAYNIAYWNLHERNLVEGKNALLVGPTNTEVAFIHFSGIDFSDLNAIFKYTAKNPFNDSWRKRRATLEDRPDLKPEFERYRSLVMQAGHEEFKNTPYAFSTYDNGEEISLLERRIYLASKEWQSSKIDPFSTGSQSFWKACRAAGIQKRKTGNIAVNSASEFSSRFRAPVAVLGFGIRVLVRLLGPDTYLKLAKFLRHQFLPGSHGFLVNGPRIDEIRNPSVNQSHDAEGQMDAPLVGEVTVITNSKS